MVSFVPVDHDPFAQIQPNLVPVDYDPFASQTPKNPGFFDRVNDRFAKRDQSLAIASEQAGNGQFPGGNAGLMFNAVGQTLQKGLNDVPAEAMLTAGNAIPQPVKQFGKDVFSSIENSPAGLVTYPVVHGGGYVLDQAAQGYNKFKQNHPTAGLYLDSTLGFGNALAATLPVKGESLPSQALAPAENAVVKGAQKLNTKNIRPTAADLKSASTANYAKAKELGGIAPPSVTDSLIDKAGSFRPTDEMVLATRGESLADKLSKNWEQFRGEPMTLERATALDQHITDLLDDAAATNKNGLLNAQGREVLEIKETLRDSLEAAAQSGEIGGGPEGLRAYQDAVKDWAAQSQISEIERIVQRASTMDNPATALKTGFRNIANNPKRLNKFPKNVRKAIIHASKDGDLTNLLRSELGSRLISGVVGAAAGSSAGPIGTVVGGVAGMAGSRIARGAAEKLQMGRVNKVVDAIAANSSLPSKTGKRLSIPEKMKANK